MKRLMLGFAGEMAAGKGTATALVKTWYTGTPSVRFSDPLREFLREFNEMKERNQFCMVPAESLVWKFIGDTLPKLFPKEAIQQGGKMGCDDFVMWLTRKWFVTPGPVKEDRENLQGLSTALRSMFAENILERTMVARIGQMEATSPFAIIEGIRREVDIGTLLTEPDFRLIYIDIDPRVAFERMKKRNENEGDAEMTWERFEELRNAEAEQQIRLLKPHAHLVIDNSGDPEVMERILRAELSKWLLSAVETCRAVSRRKVRRLSDKSLVAITLPAAMRLVEIFKGQRLYQFVHFWDSTWLILPQEAVAPSAGGWSEEDRATVNAWFTNERGFRAFMFPDQLRRFKNPFVDLVDDKLVLRSGKKKITSLD